MANRNNIQYIEIADFSIESENPLLDIHYLSGQHRYRMLDEVSDFVRKLFEDCRDRAYKIVYPGLRNGKLIELVYYRIYAPGYGPCEKF